VCGVLLTGDTPYKGARKKKGDNSKITSRIIGVEVHCGPVHGTILYYVDNLVAGGANLIIELTRQCTYGMIYKSIVIANTFIIYYHVVCLRAVIQPSWIYKYY
jgi:hypothetical protein